MTNPGVPPGHANRARALRLSIALAILTLAVDTALFSWFGAGFVFREVAPIGPGGFALVCAWQMALFASLGLAWWVLLPGPIPLGTLRRIVFGIFFLTFGCSARTLLLQSK